MVQMKKERTAMPASYGGLMRYFEEYETEVKLTPETVVMLCAVLIFIELFLHYYGTRLFALG